MKLKSAVNFIILLLPSISYAISASGHGSGHASGHVSAHVSESAHIAEHATSEHIANEAAFSRARIIATSAHTVSSNKDDIKYQVNQVSTGMMTCAAYSVESGSGYTYSECYIVSSWNGQHIPIKDYFNQFKPANAKEITMIIYESSEFQIYYN